MENFGKRLKAVRLNKGLTLVGLAFGVYTETGSTLAYTQYSKYEDGKIFPSLKTFCAICKVLDVSADYLLGLSDKEEK